MAEFKFQFDPTKKRAGTQQNVKLETWIPLANHPLLRAQEKEAVIYGSAVATLYVVKPAFLYATDKGKLNYLPSDQFDYYYTVAKLKKSPYLVLMGEEKKSTLMRKHLAENHNETNTFYLDLYLYPNFGGLRPKFFVFEKVSLDSIPNTMVLFREIRA